MQDYMRALQDRFDSPPPGDDEMRIETNHLFDSLCSGLERSKRTELIRLVDIHDARREKTALNSFISGFKLAWGISRELTEDPPYSYEAEQEERARRSFMIRMAENRQKIEEHEKF